MAAWPWIERSFSFDFPATKFPDLLERWRGTPARIAAMTNGLPRVVLTRRDEVGWSLQENVGHLVDLGYLPEERIEQILRGEEVLIAADMTNEKTNTAGHNDRDIAGLIAALRADRERLAVRLSSLTLEDWSRSAQHPRINQPMRVVDVLYFDSEHDDYHLARMRELITKFA